MAQLMPLPLTVSSFSKVQIGLTYLVPAYWVVPDKGPLSVCVCVCVCARALHLVMFILVLLLTQEISGNFPPEISKLTTLTVIVVLGPLCWHVFCVCGVVTHCIQEV